MSTEQRHIIHRQAIELRLSSRQEAHRIQSRASRLFQEEVAQRLASHFDRLGLGEAVLRIPRIEVNLGRIPIGALDGRFADQCAAAIQQEVERILRQLDLQPGFHSVVSEPFPGENALISATGHRLYALRLFLSEGILPPAYQEHSWKALEALWLEVLEQNGRSMAHMLQELARENPSGIGRLVRQFSPAWIKSLLEFLFGPAAASRAAETAAAALFQSAPTEASEFLGFPPPVWAALPERLRQQLQHWFEEQRQTGFSLSRMAQLRLQSEILRALLLYHPDDGSSSISIQLPRPAELEEGLKHRYPAGKHKEKEEGPSTPVPPRDEKAKNDKLAVQNAGLALLHPFLPAFFDTLEYLAGKHWKDKERQERAMHLLLYLAGGEEQAGECGFAVPKLFCGWPANEAVDRFIRLSEKEKQEAEELLGAVVSHWGALKSTSAGLLQSGFLQRDGLLQERQDSWLLQMERKAQDILLDKLPWGISWIKLPWMEKQVVVEW
ncbi:MAG: hypothetical protein J5I94_10660 [Phaeodactylibacter sp.]|nr:hypothetical protein [Phaeodactylibacter sp.]